MNKKYLQKIAREGIIIVTEHGEVDASSTSAVHGEGPNVTGFKFARQNQSGQRFSVDEANKLAFHLGDAAEGWATPRR